MRRETVRLDTLFGRRASLAALVGRDKSSLFKTLSVLLVVYIYAWHRGGPCDTSAIDRDIII